jgi:hypothetical protein
MWWLFGINSVQQENIHMEKFWEKPPLGWVKCNQGRAQLNSKVFR